MSSSAQSSSRLRGIAVAMGANMCCGGEESAVDVAEPETTTTVGNLLDVAEPETTTTVGNPLAAPDRELSLPRSVAAFGGLELWNRQEALVAAQAEIAAVCSATTVGAAVAEVSELIDAGDDLKAYRYLRQLLGKDQKLGYATILAAPAKLLPIAYTPTVGEACQKYGTLPLQRRGLYLSIEDKGNFAAVLKEYAASELTTDESGKPICDCMVFSDGNRILGLGDLGTWGMGIPMGKLDLYTVCGGFDPARTVPVIIDAGSGDPDRNTAGLEVREDPLYTGSKADRVRQQSEAGTEVNSAYYGEDSVIDEFMSAATDLFGRGCLLQFEDFNSNDAFPLLAEYREKYLCYNDDIQGTAAVSLAGILGGLKLRYPDCEDLLSKLQDETFLFHGAGTANLGAADLLVKEGGVSKERLFVTNSRGLIWADGEKGTFRNDEQKEYSYAGKPSFACGRDDLASMIAELKPTCLIGAVGVAPGCFDEEVVQTMVDANDDRPVIFALSNPKTQAEVTAEDCYIWSGGKAIYGSGTQFDSVVIEDTEHAPGQVNNVYIFPGMSFGAFQCAASTIPDRLFLVAAGAVANSLSEEDVALNRVIPHRDRLREVNLNVATAVVMEAQRLNLAGKSMGETEEHVKAALSDAMWSPN